MRGYIVVLCSLIAVRGVSAESIGSVQDDARSLIEAGALREAIDVYSEYLQRDDDATDIRIERARVLGWTERHGEALDDLERVIENHPEYVEARVLHGRTLGWLRRYREAEAQLRIAIAMEPVNVDAHLTLGDILLWQGRADAARATYEEVWEIDPTNAEVGLRLERLAGDRRHGRVRADVSLGSSQLNSGFDNWRQQTLALSWQGPDRWSFFGGLDRYHRSNQNDVQWTTGLVHRLRDGTTLDASISLGNNNQVLPHQVYRFGVVQKLHRNLLGTVRYKRSNYPGGTDVDTLSPTLQLWPGSPYSLEVGYTYTHASDSGSTDAGQARLLLFSGHKVSGVLGLAVGREKFIAGVTNTTTAAIRVTTSFASIQWSLHDRSAIRLSYELEHRHSSYDRNGMTLGYYYTFGE